MKTLSTLTAVAALIVGMSVASAQMSPNGTAPSAGQTALPDDLEQAAVEQVAFWFQNRDKLGLIRNRPNLGTYQQFAQLDLLPSVKTVLKTYERWMV